MLGVVDVSLLSGNNFDFTVASGTTQDVALDISGGTTLSSAALINTLLLLLGGTDTFGLAPIFPDTFYRFTHYWFAAADIPVANDIP
ncbi:hypothetical protein, partial [Klebsiella oxytoca]|uniref:hypothetical protein n=1 Tax=Klebsiella oxytoca TaxID=571 RepID=UPI0022B58811